MPVSVENCILNQLQNHKRSVAGVVRSCSLHGEAFFCYKNPMSALHATLWLYRMALRRSWESLLKNWVVSFAPWAYAALLSVIAIVVAPLGIIGGLALGVATQACISSGLYLIKNIVESGRADVKDFISGFTIYLWELLGIAFIMWIPMRLLAMSLESAVNGGLIFALVQIALYILLNPLPELVYQTRSSGIALISESYNFIVENWLEWFLPTIVLTITGYLILQVFAGITTGLPTLVQIFITAVGIGLCLSYFMIFRGFLFAELYGSTRRSRAYRYKARG
jgi:hypothetical protein